MSVEHRVGREFPLRVQKQAKRLYNNECAITGSKENLELHHILPIFWAVLYLPNHDKELIRSVHNALPLETKVHDKVHAQLEMLPEWAKINFVIGMYSYLEEMYYKDQFPEMTPDHVMHRTLTLLESV